MSESQKIRQISSKTVHVLVKKVIYKAVRIRHEKTGTNNDDGNCCRKRERCRGKEASEQR